MIKNEAYLTTGYEARNIETWESLRPAHNVIVPGAQFTGEHLLHFASLPNILPGNSKALSLPPQLPKS